MRDIITIFCVLVKPKYSVDDVVKLRDNLYEHFKYSFNMVCLTDTDFSIPNIQTYNILNFDLDTWWNKVLIFDSQFSKDTNLYFDLDVSIHEDITSLVNQVDDQHITVVDTPWKNKEYFDQKYKGVRAYKIADALFHYGNTSVMGWKGNRQFLVDMLFDDYFYHTSKHFGDDTFINKHGNVKYFDFNIKRAGTGPASILI